MTLDDLNVVCAAYAKELTNKWKFTGWKPAQDTFRLHAQWVRWDDYEGKRYYSSIQCLPIESVVDIDQYESIAKSWMKQALDDVSHLTTSQVIRGSYREQELCLVCDTDFTTTKLDGSPCKTRLVAGTIVRFYGCLTNDPPREQGQEG